MEDGNYTDGSQPFCYINFANSKSSVARKLHSPSIPVFWLRGTMPSSSERNNKGARRKIDFFQKKIELPKILLLSGQNQSYIPLTI